MLAVALAKIPVHAILLVKLVTRGAWDLATAATRTEFQLGISFPS